MEAIQGRGFSRYAAVAIAVAVLTALIMVNLSGSGQPVTATHAPANKAVASGKTLQPVDASGATEIMSATLRTSKPTDLIMSVTLECAILTKLWNAGKAPGAGPSTAAAAGQVDIWITYGDGTRVVPISSVGEKSQSPSANGDPLKDRVTFCQREEGRTITDTEVQQDGSKDGTDEVISYQDTKTANAFNWVLLNAGAGVHTFRVMAQLTDTDTPCAKDSTTQQTCSKALIGNRTFVIEPTKMANDANVA